MNIDLFLVLDNGKIGQTVVSELLKIKDFKINIIGVQTFKSGLDLGAYYNKKAEKLNLLLLKQTLISQKSLDIENLNNNTLIIDLSSKIHTKNIEKLKKFTDNSKNIFYVSILQSSKNKLVKSYKKNLKFLNLFSKLNELEKLTIGIIEELKKSNIIFLNLNSEEDLKDNLKNAIMFFVKNTKVS